MGCALSKDSMEGGVASDWGRETKLLGIYFWNINYKSWSMGQGAY